MNAHPAADKNPYDLSTILIQLPRNALVDPFETKALWAIYQTVPKVREVLKVPLPLYEIELRRRHPTFGADGKMKDGPVLFDAILRFSRKTTNADDRVRVRATIGVTSASEERQRLSVTFPDHPQIIGLHAEGEIPF